MSCYFAGGVAGLVAGAVDRVVPNGLLVVPVPAAGAGTPDCALYASTTAFVMSSGAEYMIGPLGQGVEVSMIIPRLFSCAYFMINGPIFWKIR